MQIIEKINDTDFGYIPFLSELNFFKPEKDY